MGELSTSDDARAAPGPPTPDEKTALSEDQVVPLTRLRRRIAKNLVAARRTAAHVFTSVKVDYDTVENIRLDQRESFREREGFSLTYQPFIARAASAALGEFPVVNSSIDVEAGTQTLHGRVNLGIAVDIDESGLIVVTLRDADELGVVEMARRIAELSGRARTGGIAPDEVTGSTFTITNPGAFGSYMSVPIINVPNVAILGADAVAKQPIVVEDPEGVDAVAVRPIGVLGLSWDHRAFDGSTAALFLARVRHNLETWDWEQEL